MVPNSLKLIARAGVLAGLSTLLISVPARAEYKCGDPARAMDQRACQHAEKGAAELRRFIDKLRPIESLHFYDYVDEARAREWQRAENERRGSPKREAVVELAQPVSAPLARPGSAPDARRRRAPPRPEIRSPSPRAARGLRPLLPARVLRSSRPGSCFPAGA